MDVASHPEALGCVEPRAGGMVQDDAVVWLLLEYCNVGSLQVSGAVGPFIDAPVSHPSLSLGCIHSQSLVDIQVRHKRLEATRPGIYPCAEKYCRDQSQAPYGPLQKNAGIGDDNWHDDLKMNALQSNRLFPVTVHFYPCSLSHSDSQTSLWYGSPCSTLAASHH